MVTIKEVALRAGVGIGTVSRVFNNKGAVSKVTRAKVEKAIKELNYEPNEIARNFKMQQSQSIALIIPTIWHPFYSEFAFYVESTLSEQGFKVILCNSKNDPQKEINYINMLIKNKIDGIIAITYNDIDQYVFNNLPLVSIDRHFTEDIVYVTSDNYGGGVLAAQELIKRNCQKLAYIGSVSTVKNESLNRRKGFEEEVNKQSVEYFIFEENEPLKDFDKAVESFLKKHSDIDGIFAMNDKIAKMIISILSKLGKNVPLDVQVIGYDGVKMSSDSEIMISTIRQPVKDMAYHAAMALISIIRNVSVEPRIVLPVKFIEGYTTQK